MPSSRDTTAPARLLVQGDCRPSSTAAVTCRDKYRHINNCPTASIIPPSLIAVRHASTVLPPTATLSAAEKNRHSHLDYDIVRERVDKHVLAVGTFVVEQRYRVPHKRAGDGIVKSDSGNHVHSAVGPGTRTVGIWHAEVARHADKRPGSRSTPNLQPLGLRPALSHGHGAQGRIVCGRHGRGVEEHAGHAAVILDGRRPRLLAWAKSPHLGHATPC